MQILAHLLELTSLILSRLLTNMVDGSFSYCLPCEYSGENCVGVDGNISVITEGTMIQNEEDLKSIALPLIPEWYLIDDEWNKFEWNHDAATSSFVSSFDCLARSFVWVVNLFWSFICMVIHSCGGKVLLVIWVANIEFRSIKNTHYGPTDGQTLL